MSNTVIFIVISILTVAAILWLVIYGGRRGEKHREKTTIKPSDPR